MFMLFEGVKFSEGSLKSPLHFLQAFVKGLVSSGKKLKILLGEENLYAAGSPHGPPFLDLPWSACCWELWQNNASCFSSRGGAGYSTRLPYYPLMAEKANFVSLCESK